MTRVSSFGLNKVLLSDLQRNQERVAKSQREINSGKKTDEYRGISREVETLLGAKSLRTRNFAHLDTIAEVKGKLEFNDLQLNEMSAQLNNLRQQILSAIANEDLSGLMEVANQTVSSFVNSLNTSIAGVFIFAGTRTDQEPLSIRNLSDLVAAPDAASIFNNGTVKPAARIDESIIMEFGFLANELAEPALDILRDIGIYDAGVNGPLAAGLNTTQRAFLEGIIGDIDAANAKLTQSITANGVRQGRLDDVEERLERSVTFLSIFVSDVEDVDMAEAILNLNADQAALQASFAALGGLFRVTLLDFI